MAGTKGSSERGGPAEPAKAAGIAPRLEPAGKRRKALCPSRDPRVRDEASAAKGTLESGEAFGRSRDPKGDRRGFGLDANPKGNGAVSAGPDPQGKRRRDFGSASSDPPGIGEGLRASLPKPTGTRTGLRASLRGPGEAAGAFTPRRDPEAAQREMASPPSDGSQSWDKWGPVAPPAPISVGDRRNPGAPPSPSPAKRGRGEWGSRRLIPPPLVS